MKSFLLIPKSFISRLLIVSLFFLCCSTSGFAGVKIWVGGAGLTLNWTTAANWSPANVPASGDDVVFNTAGTLTFTTGPAASVALNSFKVIQGSLTLPASSARILTLGGASGIDFSISHGATFTIGNNVTITLAAGAAAEITGALALSGGNFTVNGNSTVNYDESGSENILATTYGDLTIEGGGTKTLTGTTTVSGILTMTAGTTLNMANTNLTVGALTGAGNLTHSSGTAGARTLAVNGTTSPAAYTGIISNGNATSVLLSKNGTGTLTLAGTNTYTGGTTLAAGTLVAANTQALGTIAGTVTLNGGVLSLDTDASMSAYKVVVGGDATIISNRATSGAAITHTLGTLSIGNFQLISGYGANVSSGKPGLTFGTTTLSAASPVFDIQIDVNLTLGALAGNVPFTKQNYGLMILNTASGRTGGTVTVNEGSLRLGSASALGTAAVPIVLNATTSLNLAINTSVNAYPLTVNGLCAVISNRSTPGPGITHTMGTLTSSSHLTMHIGDNVTDVTAGLIFGNTTFTGGIPEFDVSSGGATLTLGALAGNFPFIKMGGGIMILKNASARTGGTVNIESGTVSLGITNALGTTGVPIQLNGGTLDLATNTTVNAYNITVAGDAAITSNRSTTGAGITHILGTLSIGANKLDIDQGSNVTSGTSAVQFGNFTMTGNVTLSPNTAKLVMAGVATGAFKLTKKGLATLQKTTTAWTLGGDFEIAEGTYDATTQNTTIQGNWINNGGTHTATGASTVTFSVGNPQSIGGTSPTTFNHLTIDNTNGVSLGNNVTVNAVLTLANAGGILTIPTGRTLTIANGTAANAIVSTGAGFGAGKHIAAQVSTLNGAKGFLRVNNIALTNPYLFPVGDGTNYLPVTLTPSAATLLADNSFSVCSFKGITTNGEPNGTLFSAAQKNNCVDAIWTVNYNGTGTPTQLTGSTGMTVKWPQSLEGINFQTYSGTMIGIAHYGAPFPGWGDCAGSGTNTGSGGDATRSPVTTFSPFGVGRQDPSGGVLAIKITYFNAAKGSGYNTLNWQAACSSSQAIFEVERSTDGINFTTITSLTASQARCAQPFNYSDNTAPSGTVFYRLKVVDVDGRSSYSAIVKLNTQAKDILLAGLSPNPVVNVAQLRISTTKKDMVDLSIVSLEGKVVYRNSIQLQPGSSVINLDIANLAGGMYMIKGVFSDGQTNTLKFTKK